MDEETIRTEILNALKRVAPDADPSTIDPRLTFREQFEIDSVDFLNLVLGLEKSTGIPIPDQHYPRLATLDGALGYLMEHSDKAASSAG